MKKIVALLMVMAMVMSSGIVVFAQESGDMILFDADTAPDAADDFFVDITDERHAQDKTYSAKVVISEVDRADFNFPEGLDLTEYSGLKIKIASQYAYATRVNVRLEKKNEPSVYWIKKIVVERTDFTEIYVPLSDFETYGSNYQPDAIGKIQLYFTGWGLENEMDSAGIYYIDSIIATKDVITTDVYDDIDFSEDEAIILDYGQFNFRQCTRDEENTLFGHSTAKWAAIGAGGQAGISGLNIDTDGFDYVSMYLYSPEITDKKIGIRTGSAGVELMICWEGWQRIDIPLSKLGAPKVMTDFWLWDNGWNYDYGGEGQTMNIGKIWLSKALFEQPVLDLGTAQNPAVLDAAKTYHGRQTAKFDASGQSHMDINWGDGIDVSGYDKLSIMMYSPAATNETVGIILYNLNAYTIKYITIDWEGWKKVSINLSEYSDRDLTAITDFKLYNHGWNCTYIGEGKYLNIAKIWFEKDKAALEDILFKDLYTGSFWNFKKDADLTNVDSISFDMTCEKIGDYDNNNYYVTVVANDGNGNKAKTVLTNFEGTRTITIPVKDFSLTNLENVSFTYSSRWSISGVKTETGETAYTAVDEKDGVTEYVDVAISNFKLNYNKNLIDVKYVEDYISVNNGTYVVADDMLYDNFDYDIIVTDKSSGKKIETDTMVGENKIYIDFEKEYGHKYDVQVRDFVGITGEEFFDLDYTVTVAGEEPVSIDGFEVNYQGYDAINRKVSYTYENGTDTAKSAILIIGIYEGNKLDSVILKNYKQLLSKRKGMLDIAIDDNIDVTGKTIRAFVLDGWESLIPLEIAQPIQ